MTPVSAAVEEDKCPAVADLFGDEAQRGKRQKLALPQAITSSPGIAQPSELARPSEIAPPSELPFARSKLRLPCSWCEGQQLEDDSAAQPRDQSVPSTATAGEGRGVAEVADHQDMGEEQGAAVDQDADEDDSHGGPQAMSWQRLLRPGHLASLPPGSLLQGGSLATRPATMHLPRWGDLLALVMPAGHSLSPPHSCVKAGPWFHSLICISSPTPSPLQPRGFISSPTPTPSPLQPRGFSSGAHAGGQWRQARHHHR